VPAPPTDAEKVSYGSRSLLYLTVALTISAACAITAQAWFEVRNPIVWPLAIYTGLYLIYQAVSLPVNFAGGHFDLAVHQERVAGWLPSEYPVVDILLPICGEPIEVLRNTWTGVFELIQAYPGIAVAYVLDDGPCDEAMQLAPAFGFEYIRRPELRHRKKAGNLNYAFGRTSGEHVVIFDADFRPRSDFLAELLPYMDDPQVGIVQSPQFFRVAKGQSWVERAASASLEVFYRAVQVSRDRVGSALCVGSNAVYRRAALECEGGFTLIPYAEDSHTGLDLRRHGYQLKYLPVVLAAGVCPATLDSYMRQQYRWCCGATSLIWTRHMWRVRMRLRSRLPYLAGWLWNFLTGLRALMLPLFPIVLLAFLPGEIELHNAILFIPVLLNAVLLYPLWHNTRYPLGMWPLSLAVGWAQVLALWDYAQGKVMSWEASRGPGDATRRFRKAVRSWNGSLAVAWLALAAWRLAEHPSSRFVIIVALGVVNACVVGRLVFPGRKAL
jgi:cellulose synthase/poly-beta-1,6-N-acetylglucosamine synthase-like glycosyltransferase